LDVEKKEIKHQYQTLKTEKNDTAKKLQKLKLLSHKQKNENIQGKKTTTS